MTYSIIYSPVALETFDEITEQIKQRWGDRYADDFKQRAVKVIETIELSPFIFQSVESNADIRKGFIHKNCSIFYKVTDTHISILFFWDNRQDPVFL